MNQDNIINTHSYQYKIETDQSIKSALISKLPISVDLNQDQLIEKIDSLIHNYRKYIDNINSFFYYKDSKKKETKRSKSTKIKVKWFKIFFKEQYYQSLYKNSNDKKLSFDNPELDFFHKWLSQVDTEFTLGGPWIGNSNSILQELNSCVDIIRMEKGKEVDYQSKGKANHENLNLIITKLNSRNSFKVFHHLFKESSFISHNNLELFKTIQSLGEEVNNQIDELLTFFNKNSRVGRRVFKGSFNYYTIKKQPKIYNDKRKELINKNSLEFKIEEWFLKTYTDNSKKLTKENIEEIKDCFKTDTGWLNKEFTLEELYFGLKKYKATKKSKFIENIKSNKISDKLDQFPVEFSLFFPKKIDNEINNGKSKDFTNDYKEFINVIKNENTQSNPAVKQKYYKSCANFVIFVDFYTIIAKRYGESQNILKQMNSQYLESQNVNRYGVIVSGKEEKAELWTYKLEDDNFSNIHSCIISLPNTKSPNSISTININYLHCINFNSLEKLFFKQTDKENFISNRLLDDKDNSNFTQNSLLNKIEFKEESKKIPSGFYDKSGNELNIYEYLQSNESKTSNRYSIKNGKSLVNLYKKLLSLDSVKSIIGLNKYNNKYNNIDTIINTDYENLEDFVSAVDTKLYVWLVGYLDHSNQNYKLLTEHCEKFNFRIGGKNSKDISKDFRKNKSENCNTPTTIINKIVDKQVKSNRSTINVRISPEFSMFYRGVKNNSKNKLIYTNRKNYDQLTLQISTQSNIDGIRYSKDYMSKFKDIDGNPIDIQKSNNSKYLNKILGLTEKIIYSFGIDRGENSLATMCLTKIKTETYATITSLRSNTFELVPLNFYKQVIQVVNSDLSSKELYYNYYNPSQLVNINSLKEFNQSKFIPSLFEKLEDGNQYSIDLSMAKLVSVKTQDSDGNLESKTDKKLLINGDPITYFKYIGEVLMRKIHSEYEKNQITNLGILNSISIVINPKKRQNQTNKIQEKYNLVLKILINNKPVQVTSVNLYDVKEEAILKKILDNRLDELKKYYKDIYSQNTDQFKMNEFNFNKLENYKKQLSNNIISVMEYIKTTMNINKLNFIYSIEHFNTQENNKKSNQLINIFERQLFKRLSKESLYYIPQSYFKYSENKRKIKNTDDKAQFEAQLFSNIVLINKDQSSKKCFFCLKCSKETSKKIDCGNCKIFQKGFKYSEFKDQFGETSVLKDSLKTDDDIKACINISLDGYYYFKSEFDLIKK